MRPPPKAGGFYVALDCALSADRLRFMFEDAACAVLLTVPELVGSSFAWRPPVSLRVQG